MSDALSRRLEELRQQAEQYGNAARDAYRLDQLRKITRARLMKDSDASSIAAKETEAMASQEYEQIMHQAAEAEGLRVGLRSLHEVAMKAMSVWQTERRAEAERMKHLGDVT